MKLLVVASDPMEFKGILRHASQTQSRNLPIDWSRSATLNGNQVLLAANGVGWSRAAAAVDAGQSFGPEAVVSTGFCGALDPTLRIGDIIVDGGPVQCARPHRQAPIHSSNRIAQTAAEKRELFQTTRAAVVEMEAAGVAGRARALGIPFYCIKAVSDLANETMVNDFNGALRPDGHFDTMLIIRRSLRHPAARLPELIRLRNRSVRASNALGEFFADCQF